MKQYWKAFTHVENSKKHWVLLLCVVLVIHLFCAMCKLGIDKDDIEDSVCVAGDTLFWITKNGDLYGAGENYCNTISEKNTPFVLKKRIMKGVQSVCAGTKCIFVQNKDGTVMAWGQNIGGQLMGCEGTANAPATLLEHVASISIGTVHCAALTEDNTLVTWGSNQFGQLGIGSIDNAYHHIEKPEVNKMCLVRAYGMGTFGIDEENCLYYWGRTEERSACGNPECIAKNIIDIRCMDGQYFQALTVSGELVLVNVEDTSLCGNRINTKEPVETICDYGYISENNVLYSWKLCKEKLLDCIVASRVDFAEGSASGLYFATRDNSAIIVDSDGNIKWWFLV